MSFQHTDCCMHSPFYAIRFHTTYLRKGQADLKNERLQRGCRSDSSEPFPRCSVPRSSRTANPIGATAEAPKPSPGSLGPCALTRRILQAGENGTRAKLGRLLYAGCTETLAKVFVSALVSPLSGCFSKIKAPDCKVLLCHLKRSTKNIRAKWADEKHCSKLSALCDV